MHKDKSQFKIPVNEKKVRNIKFCQGNKLIQIILEI